MDELWGIFLLLGALWLIFTPSHWKVAETLFGRADTQADVAECIHRNHILVSTPGAELPADIVVSRCRAKYSVRIPSKYTGRITGNMAPSSSYYWLNGAVTNPGKAWVITGLKIEVQGDGKSFTKVVKDLWVQPSGYEQVFVGLTSQEWKSVDPANAKNKFSWSILSAEGVKVELR